MRPRAWRRLSATRPGNLLGYSVQIASKDSQVHWRCALEGRDGGVGRNESTASQGSELADWHAISRNDEAFATLQLAHDLATLVAKLTLRYLPCHASYCSTPCYKRRSPYERLRRQCDASD
jgi:hypothetical protein